jgi:molecular chaperone GrpE (heat shock protein)
VDLAIRVVIDALLSVQKKIEMFANRLGLVPFPKPGDPFDPARHDPRPVSTARREDDGLVKQVLYTGYRLPVTDEVLCRAYVEVWKFAKP